MKIIRVLAGAFFGLLLLAAPAAAQQYPPTSQAPASTQVLGFGAQRPGETFNKRDCGFQGGAQASIRVNETAAGSKAAGSDGCVALSVKIVAQDRVSVDGREFPARRCAANSIFVTAPSSAGTSRTVENQFNIDCGPAAAAGTLPRTGTGLTMPLAASAALLIGAGAVAVVASRRRRTA